MECCRNRKSFCVVLKTIFLRPCDLEELYIKMIVLLENLLNFIDNEELGDSYNETSRILQILEKLVECFKLLCELETVYSLMSPISSGRGVLVGNNRFVERDHVLD